MTERFSRRLRLLAGGMALFVVAHRVHAQCDSCAAPSFGPAPRVLSIRPPDLLSYYSDPAYAVATGDFNSDGRLDLVVPTGFGLVVVPGAGGGAFATPTFDGPLEIGASIAVADFDGDGHPDVATGNYGPNIVTVFLGDGVGGFRTPWHFTAYLGVKALAAADFDGDGRIDLALAAPAEGRVVVLHGLGTGKFVALGSLAVGVNPRGLAAGDLDGDGLADLAVADEGDGNVYVLRARANALPEPFGTHHLGDKASVVAIGDVDGGALDLVVGGFNWIGDIIQSVSILHGHGDGTFDPPVTGAAGGEVTGLALADVDGDGDLDLGASSNDGHLMLFQNDGAGHLSEPIFRTTGDQAVGVTSADFDGDGRPDFAVAGGYDGDVFVFPTGSDHQPLEVPTFPYGEGARSLALVDMDGNGTLDAVTSNWWTRDIAILSGTGTGTFDARHAFSGTNSFGTMAIGDLDGDLLPDVVASSDGFEEFYVLMNLGANNLGEPTTFESLRGVSPIGLEKLDGDAFLDLVATSDTSAVIHFGTGDGGFGAAVEIPGTEAEPFGAVGDLDLDGNTDLVLGPGPGPESAIRVLLGQGDGSFTPGVSYPVGLSTPLVVADADGDGKPDVITGAQSPWGIYVLYGDGEGALEPPAFFPTFARASAIVVTDVNGYGQPDIVAAGGQTATVSVRPGIAPRSFGAEVLLGVPSLAGLVAAGDLDGDGKPDLAAACDNYGISGGVLTVLRNTRCESRHLALDGIGSACRHPGQAFPQQPSLRVIDDGGNTAACAEGNVAAALVPATGTAGAALLGTASAPVTNGVASFTDLGIDLSGSGYVLAFTHSDASTRSGALSVADDPPAPTASATLLFCPGETIALYATTVPGASYFWTGPNGFASSLQSPTIPSATEDASGVYSVVAMVGGCASQAAATEVNLGDPVIGATIEGPLEVCVRARLQLSVPEDAFAYQWSWNGEPIPYATASTYTVASAAAADAGDYRVTTVSAGGCVSVASAPASVVVIEGCGVTAMDFHVDPASGKQSNGNGVIEPGETAVVVPTWRNAKPTAITLSGTASSLTGPAPAAYVLADPSANYGPYAPVGTHDCLEATGDCYAVSISTPSGQRPAVHWDARLDETPSTGDPTRTWTLHVGGSFLDVPVDGPLYPFVENALHAGITSGCGGGLYCPGAPVTRAQMAVFLLRAEHGATYVPGPGTGIAFTDVPPASFAADWIERLGSEGITAGCGGGRYCPSDPVSRKQMAVFLLRVEHGIFYTPPAATGVFADVPLDHSFARWIEQLSDEGVTAGCGGGPAPAPVYFCPDAAVTRGQMAVFMSKTFGLTLYEP